MPKATSFIGLDVGEKRIGVAVGDSGIRIAVPFDTIDVNGREIEALTEIVIREKVDVIVVGYPRNQSGETTKQTQFVEDFVKKIENIGPKIVYQDESLTSVMAEDRLIAHKRPYTKADIDAQAASIILQDYIENYHA